MVDPRLEVTDALGRRTISVGKDVFRIGRRTDNDLCLTGADVSREHAEIRREGEQYLIKDRGSRYGTFVNGEQVDERALQHGDVVRLGRSGGVEFTFVSGDTTKVGARVGASSAVGDLRQLTSLLEGLRALGSGRVLDDVLALVIDSALEVTGAERGFIMLASRTGELEFKLGRARGRFTLPGKSFDTSRKIPEEVFATGEPLVVADLLDGDFANVHHGTIALGIRHVLCLPLNLVRYVDRRESSLEEPKRIGVLYLDSRERGSLLSRGADATIETLAMEAAVAIENARLYRETIEKARLDEELKIAAEIQKTLLPQARHSGGFYDAIGANLACRAIGGDFFDYVDLSDNRFGFAITDVSGKGAPAALLTAVLQGAFAAQADMNKGPAETMAKLNRALTRRAIESRFATMVYATLAPDGSLSYTNAGHNAPFLLQRSGVRRLDRGGLILGLFEEASYEEERLRLEPGDVVVMFTDGVSEALSAYDEEFGDDRILECLKEHGGKEAKEIIRHLLDAVQQFTVGADQHDDLTVLVVRYLGNEKPTA